MFRSERNLVVRVYIAPGRVGNPPLHEPQSVRNLTAFGFETPCLRV